MFGPRSLIALQSALIALVREDDGQDLVEYALILACVALGVVAAAQSLTGSVSSVFTKTGSTITSTV